MFEGGKVVMNVEENRVQILFDGKPEEEIRFELKHSGFRWFPRQVTRKWMLPAEQRADQSEYREEQEPQLFDDEASLSCSQQMMQGTVSSGAHFENR